MFQNEDEFKKIVSRLDIDEKPNPAHRESLHGQMLSVFNKAGEQPIIQSRHLWRTIMKSPIKKFAIAAAIIVAALIFTDILLINDKGIAFADVLEQIRTFRPYSCTVTTQYGGKPAIKRRVMKLTNLRRREVYPDGYIQIFDLSQDPVKMLAIHPDKMLAIEKISPDIESGRDFDLLRHLSIIQDEADDRLIVEDLGVRQIEGKTAQCFRVPGQNNDWAIWADAQTGLPVRIELIHPKIGQIITMSEFEFDVDFDESLFAMTAPEGYTVKRVVVPTEQDLIEGLAVVARFLGGEFPSVSEFLLPPLQKVLAEYIEQNNLSPSQDEMHSLGEKLSPATKYFARINSNKDFFKPSYVGGGVKLGDADTAILWYTPQGTPNYHVIYGDLSVREVAPNNLPIESKEADTMVALEIELPKPMFVGTPQNVTVPHLEKPLGKPRPTFYAPVGTTNVAFGKPVSSTDEFPIIGELEWITDGDKEGADGSFVELGPFPQSITIDLEAEHNIYAIVFWHYHKEAWVFFDVVVQVADDPDFITNVRTLFNNDIDNSLGLGVGKDMHYTETAEGKLIDAKGVRARYVRLHSNGSTGSDANHYIEVEVYGKTIEQ